MINESTIIVGRGEIHSPLFRVADENHVPHHNARKRVSFSLPIKTNNFVFTILLFIVCVCVIYCTHKNIHIQFHVTFKLHKNV